MNPRGLEVRRVRVWEAPTYSASYEPCSRSSGSSPRLTIVGERVLDGRRVAHV